MGKKKDKKIDKQARMLVLLFIGALLALILIGYVILKVWWNGHASDISINYYITLAGILPVLLIALFLTRPDSKRRKAKQSLWQLMLAPDKTEGLVGFTVGEVACLVVIAINHSTTLLFVASLVGALLMVMITFQRIVYGTEN